MNVRPLTLGPIVGATTSTSVRLWGRAAYEPTDSGPRRAFGVARLRAHKTPASRARYGAPLVFKMSPNFDMTGVVVFDALEPETPYEYQLGYVYSNDDEETLARSTFDWRAVAASTFRTGTDDPSRPRSIVVGSCRYLSRLFGGTWVDGRGDKTFESVLRQMDEEGRPLDALLMVGDQIYADDLGFLRPLELLDDYLKRYREVFSQPKLRELMSRVPTYMMLDDHEIEDAWPKNATSADLRVKYPAALHAYQVYQASHGPLFDVRGHRIDGVPDKLWYRFQDGCCDFFVMDLRTERVLADRPEESRIVSPTQMAALFDWLSDGSGRVKLVVSSVPLFPETRYKGWDHWSGFPGDRDALLAHIVENHVERVVFLSGDVHASVTTELRGVAGTEGKIVSIVSSPFFWPYPDVAAHTLTLEGAIRSGEYVFELAEAGPVHITDNFTRVSVHPDRVEAAVFSRKGQPLPPVKVHYF